MKNMRKSKIALLVIVSSSLLVGCSTQRHAATEWEYKVVGTPDGGGFGRSSYEEKFLNDNAAGGWVLVDRGKPENGMNYLFKRPKK